VHGPGTIRTLRRGLQGVSACPRRTDASEQIDESSATILLERGAEKFKEREPQLASTDWNNVQAIRLEIVTAEEIFLEERFNQGRRSNG